MTGGFQNPLDYDVDKLREAANLEIDEIDKVETPNYTHRCQVCRWPEEVNDYQKHTPNWCENCEEVQTFEKIPSEELK